MKLSRRKLLLSGAVAAATPGLAGLLLSDDEVEAEVVRDQSLWMAQTPPIAVFEQFEGPRQVDLAVVGGGYTGLSCAYYVKKKRPDWDVVVIDSHEVGSGASSRNTGAVYARHVGIDDPGFAERGLARLRTFIDEQEIGCDFSAAPTLTMARTGSDAATAKSNLKTGEKWVSGGELAERTGSRYYAGAVQAPGYYKLHPVKLLNGHVQAALDAGVEIYSRSPALHVAHGKPSVISTPRGELVAKQAMIATNAYTPRLGVCRHKMYPLHQYSLASRKLSATEIEALGLDHWTMRFEPNLLPVTFSVTPEGNFFVRMVLGYASSDSQVWQDSRGARELATRLFAQRYPDILDLGLDHGWHGITGHTPLFRPIAGVLGQGNVHISVAYNGLGIMPGHNSGYLSACRIVGEQQQDVDILTSASTRVPFPGDFYRSLMLKPVMNLLTPV